MKAALLAADDTPSTSARSSSEADTFGHDLTEPPFPRNSIENQQKPNTQHPIKSWVGITRPLEAMAADDAPFPDPKTQKPSVLHLLGPPGDPGPVPGGPYTHSLGDWTPDS